MGTLHDTASEITPNSIAPVPTLNIPCIGSRRYLIR